MNLKAALIILFILSSCASLNAQEDYSINNFKVNYLVDSVIVTYKLRGIAGDEYNVELFLVNKNTQEEVYEPYFVKGNLGDTVVPGNNKSITWYFMKELRKDVDWVNFSLKLTVKDESIHWLYYVGGAAAAGLVWMFVLDLEEPEELGPETPIPPGRP